MMPELTAGQIADLPCSHNYEADGERLFSDVVIDAGLADFGLVPAFLLGIDLKALCTPEEAAIVNAFLAAMNENNPAWMSFVCAKGVGDHVEEDARAQLDAFRKAFEQIPH
jgi:predicted nucleotidyltransferase